MMNYDVLITPINGHFQATVIGLPNVTVEAHTRQEVIERVKSAAAEILASSELVKIELEVAPPINALAAFGGMWQENELFDEFISAIQQYRQEVDAHNAPESLS